MRPDESHDKDYGSQEARIRKYMATHGSSPRSDWEEAGETSEGEEHATASSLTAHIGRS